MTVASFTGAEPKRELAVQFQSVSLKQAPMVTVAWGNFLALVPPGIIVIFALQGHIKPVEQLMSNPSQISATGAVGLLLLVTLAGIMLDALRRTTLDVALGKTRSPLPERLYEHVTPDTLELFQTSVENSYKYYCCYGGLFWAFLVVIAVHVYDNACGRPDILLFLLAAVAGSAAWIQDKSFYGRMKDFITVEKRLREREEKKPDV